MGENQEPNPYYLCFCYFIPSPGKPTLLGFALHSLASASSNFSSTMFHSAFAPTPHRALKVVGHLPGQSWPPEPSNKYPICKVPIASLHRCLQNPWLFGPQQNIPMAASSPSFLWILFSSYICILCVTKLYRLHQSVGCFYRRQIDYLPKLIFNTEATYFWGKKGIKAISSNGRENSA